MSPSISRRRFLGRLAAAAGSLTAASTLPAAQNAPQAKGKPLGFPLVDFHAHLTTEGSLGRGIETARQHGIKLGVVVHAGTKENAYPDLVSDDAGLKKYLALLDGKPVYKGVQAEGLDWPTCFSKGVAVRLDYVLSDAMTMPDRTGRRVRLWGPDVRIGDPQDFMDRYVDYHVRIMGTEPIDILANTTYLPAALVARYDELWTPKRWRKIVEAAIKHHVALEISASLKAPKLGLLRVAKEAGAKFSFGSNTRLPRVNTLDYCIEMARKLPLTKADMFVPALAGRKPIQVRGS
jgi:hypothetical protein